MKAKRPAASGSQLAVLSAIAQTDAVVQRRHTQRAQQQSSKSHGPGRVSGPRDAQQQPHKRNLDYARAT